MDGARFDDLSRTLAAGISRRQAVKGITAGLLCALGLRGSSEAQVSQISCGNTACASNPGICKPGCVCCVYANPLTGRVMNSRCRPPGTCSPGDTVCPPGKIADPIRGCVDPCSGPNSCPQPPAGSCQIATCAPSGLCGIATASDNTTCGAGKACCDGACTTLGTASNCSGCGNVCTANEECTAGTCTCLYETCNGACCAAVQVCTGGVCAARAGDGQPCDSTGENDCQNGLTCCSGTCRDLQSNPDYCGACEDSSCPAPNPNNCEGARICAAGQCGFTAAESTTICRPSAGPCDPAEYCNGSSLTCPADVKTANGQPGTCGGGQVCCGGSCTALGTTSNCATCGNTCSASQACVGGICTQVCTSQTCGQVAGCGVGATCTPPEGSGAVGTCQADGQCCVASGAPSGGVPGQWCSAVNCCGGCFVNTSRCF